MFPKKLYRKSKHILCFINFFFRKYCRLWDNVKTNIVEQGRPEMTVWRMCIACWMPKATGTRAEYVIHKLLSHGINGYVITCSSVISFYVICLLLFSTWLSWIRASWYNYENNQQDDLYRLIYYSKSAVHVPGDVFAHHHEHLTVFTVSGSVQPSCCRLVSRMSWNWTM